MLAIWSLLIPGIFDPLNHKFNSISLSNLTKEVKNYSSKKIFILHVSYLDNCNGSLMHDFQFAERLKHYIKDTDFYLLPMPNYEITKCIEAFSWFEKDYAKLDANIFQYYKKNYTQYPDFIFFKASGNFNLFLNKNLSYDLNAYESVKYSDSNQIWLNLSFLSTYLSSYPGGNPNYLMLKLKK
jgi:hypothetical protein